MSDDRKGNTGFPGKGMNDSEFYEDLYDDLPKEVVDILMQTHPLKNNDGETQARGSRRPSREDVEEVREARMQQVGSEINEIRKAPQQEGEPTRYVSRRARNSGIVNEPEGNNSGEDRHNIEQDEYDDGIQYVSVMPARKKSKLVEEAAMQTSAPPRRKKPKDEDVFDQFATQGRRRYEELDFEEKAKQENLDSLYDDDYDDEYDGGPSKLVIILGVVALILIGFLIFRCVSLGSQLENAQNQITANEDLNERYESLQLENMRLEEELAALKDPDAANENADGEDGENNETNNNQTNNTGNTSNTGNTGNTSSGSTQYTVVEGDTAWTIAQKTLGNGAEYQKILDANNLSESDVISVGQVLTIPAA